MRHAGAEKPDGQKLALLALIDAEYTRHPFFGSRKMTMYLGGMRYRLTASEFWDWPAWRRGRTPACRIRGTRFILTCSEAW
jgi:hypothetical protein